MDDLTLFLQWVSDLAEEYVPILMAINAIWCPLASRFAPYLQEGIVLRDGTRFRAFSFKQPPLRY